MAKRVKIGDVIEIATDRGLAYAHYTHRVPRYGALIRVFEDVHRNRPSDMGPLIDGSVQFMTFFPLQAALNQGLVELVGNEPLPEDARELPTFRAAGFVDRDGSVKDWWIDDGKRQFKVKRLSDEQKIFPIQQVVNDTALVEMIEEGWVATDQV